VTDHPAGSGLRRQPGRLPWEIPAAERPAGRTEQHREEPGTAEKPRATAAEARAILAAEHPLSRAARDTTQARRQRKRPPAAEEIRRLRSELRAAEALVSMLQRENAALKESH